MLQQVEVRSRSKYSTLLKWLRFAEVVETMRYFSVASKFLKRIFEPQKDQVSGQFRKWHGE